MSMADSPDSIFTDAPQSSQNPILSERKFIAHCDVRFHGLFSLTFGERLKEFRNRNLMRSVYEQDGISYYSTFQTWPLRRILVYGKSNDGARELNTQFETILKLLLRLQDFYLPEVRSDCRFGELRRHSGFFRTRTSHLLSHLRRWRVDDVAAGYLDRKSELSNCGLGNEELLRWVRRLYLDAESIDPLSAWNKEIRFVSYWKREKLQYDALLAQDFREMAAVLALFLRECGLDDDFFPHVLLPGLIRGSDSLPPPWMQQLYGAALDRPFDMLEYVANELGLNPRPRAILLTEGEEWIAFQRLFEFYGFDPALLGIEFRSLGGHGNFSLEKWQHFIEYMHEKQVLVYFAVDREGNTARQAEELLSAKRRFLFPNLTKVIPVRSRIAVWDTCFEGSNFTDDEIVAALAKQGLAIEVDLVKRARTPGKGGLITRLRPLLKRAPNKQALVRDLADLLIASRQTGMATRKRRPFETRVVAWGRQTMINHLPTTARSREANLRSGWLG